MLISRNFNKYREEHFIICAGAELCSQCREENTPFKGRIAGYIGWSLAFADEKTKKQTGKGNTVVADNRISYLSLLSCAFFFQYGTASAAFCCAHQSVNAVLCEQRGLETRNIFRSLALTSAEPIFPRVCKGCFL